MATDNIVVPNTTPGLLCRELLPGPRATPDLSHIFLFCWTESYTRMVAPRLAHGVVRCRKLITSRYRALPENEIETMYYIYSSYGLRVTPGLHIKISGPP